MGIGPLDWIDQNGWSRELRLLGEGTAQEKASVRPRGMLAIQGGGLLSKSAQTLYEIVCEHDLLKTGGRPGAKSGEALNVAINCLAWLEAGGQVFDFERSLMKELEETDVSDVSVSEINLPYEALYIRFAGSVSDSLDRPLDGLMIERRHAQETIIAVTPFRRFGGTMHADPMCVFSIQGDMTIVEALEHEIRRTSSPGKAKLMHGDTMIDQSMTKYVAGQKMADIQSEAYAAMNESGKRLRILLPLIVNSLLFIDGCRSHIARGWPTGSPDKLAAKAAVAKRGETRARDTLLRGNWREAHLCTLESEIAAGAVMGDAPAPEPTNGPRSHWRRGHWRRQPHGPGNSLRKRIRIRATIVGRARSTAPVDRTYRIVDQQKSGF